MPQDPIQESFLRTLAQYPLTPEQLERAKASAELARLQRLDSIGLADAVVPPLQFAMGASLPGRLAMTGAAVAGVPSEEKFRTGLEGVAGSVLPNFLGSVWNRIRSAPLPQTTPTALTSAKPLLEMLEDPLTGEWSVGMRQGAKPQAPIQTPFVSNQTLRGMIPEFTSFKPQKPLKVPELDDLINARNTVYHATSLEGFKKILETGGIIPNPYLHMGKGEGAFKKWALEQGEINTAKPKPWVVWQPGVDDKWFETQADAQKFAQAVGGGVRFDESVVEQAKKNPKQANSETTIESNPNTGVSVSRISRIAPKAEKAISFVIDRSKMPKNRPIAEQGYRKTVDTTDQSANIFVKYPEVVSKWNAWAQNFLENELMQSPNIKVYLETWKQKLDKYNNLKVKELTHTILPDEQKELFNLQYGSSFGDSLEPKTLLDKAKQLAGYSKLEDWAAVYAPEVLQKPHRMNKQFEYEDRTFNTPIPLTAVKGVIADRSVLTPTSRINFEQAPQFAKMILSKLKSGATLEEIYNHGAWKGVSAHPEIKSWLPKIYWDIPAAQLKQSLEEALINISQPKTTQVETLKEIQQLLAPHSIPFKAEESGRSMHGYRGRLRKDIGKGTPLFGLGAALAAEWQRLKSKQK